MKSSLMLAGFAWFAAACGGNDTCDPVANTGCDGNQTCELTTAGASICAEPVVVRGKVFKLADSSAVAGARVMALDPNRAPASTVVTTSQSGDYELPIRSTRDANGVPTGANITLRVDAQGFLTFPSGVRQALPISTAAPVETSGKLVVMSALTDVGLIASGGGAGTGAIVGKADVPANREGVLVVAETAAGPSGMSAIADSSGNYAIYNVPSGTFTVKAYAKGVSYDPGSATISGTQTATVDLHINTAKTTSKVSGAVQIVATSGMTSVILVVESTFNATLARGEAPPGLRAPAPPAAPSINGAFTIEGVPEGRYVVLAAFENDNLVRDPDTAISGTQILHLGVTAGVDATIGSGFKITDAVTMVGPGLNGPESVAAKPLLAWSAYPSADRYRVTVYDALGASVFTGDTLKGTNSIQYTGPLDHGMYYQFHVEARKDVTPPPGYVPISTTEDLRGVFFLP